MLLIAFFLQIILSDGVACGVRLTGNEEVLCRRAVVSGAGFVNTAKLLTDDVRTKYGVPRQLSNVNQSAGFVMCNIGIDASPASIGVTNTNTWHVSHRGWMDGWHYTVCWHLFDRCNGFFLLFVLMSMSMSIV